MKNKDIEGLVFLEFNKSTDSNLDIKQERHPQYFGINVAMGAVNSNKISSFDLVDPNNPIVKVNVWTDDFVTGVSFTLNSGTTSQILWRSF